MNEPNDDDGSIYAASERHAQIMRELQIFGNRLAWGCLGIIVVAIATIYFFFKYHPFWKYP
jgi:hypothetical protein